MMEISKDVDAYRASTYYHKDKDSKGEKYMQDLFGILTLLLARSIIVTDIYQPGGCILVIHVLGQTQRGGKS